MTNWEKLNERLMGKCTWKHQHLHLVSGVNISMMRNLEPYTAVTQDKIQLP